MDKNHGGILARIYIKLENGSEVCYIYEHEIVKNIVVKSNQDPYTTLLNVGDKFHFEDADYEVKRIATNFLNQTDSEYMNYGMNMYGIGEQLPFNFEIVYIVDKI